MTRKNKYLIYFLWPILFIFIAATTLADTNKTIYLQSGVPAPWDGILLKPINAAKLLQDVKTANKRVQAWKTWANNRIKINSDYDNKACDLQVQYWKEGYKTMQKQKTPHGVPIWEVIVITVGALGLGVGLGVGLGLHYSH